MRASFVDAICLFHAVYGYRHSDVNIRDDERALDWRYDVSGALQDSLAH